MGLTLAGVNLCSVPKYKKGRSKKKYHAYRRLRKAGFSPLALSWIRK